MKLDDSNRPKPMWEIEREHIKKTLIWAAYDLDLTAVVLEMSRSTLYRRVRDYDLERVKTVAV